MKCTHRPIHKSQRFMVLWSPFWMTAFMVLGPNHTRGYVCQQKASRRQLSRAPDETKGEIQVLANGCLMIMSKVNEERIQFRFSNNSIPIFWLIFEKSNGANWRHFRLWGFQLTMLDRVKLMRLQRKVGEGPLWYWAWSSRMLLSWGTVSILTLSHVFQFLLLFLG